MNLKNFTLKFQAVAEKMAKNFRGLLFLATPCIYGILKQMQKKCKHLMYQPN